MVVMVLCGLLPIVTAVAESPQTTPVYTPSLPTALSPSPTAGRNAADPVQVLIDRSNAIVRGKVVANRVTVVENVNVGEQSLPVVETEMTVDVLQRIKGIAFPQHAKVILPERCLLQEGECFGSTIKVGEELVFFLTLSRIGRWIALGAREGVQRVVEDRLAVSNLGIADLVSRVGKNIPQGLPKGPTPEQR